MFLTAALWTGISCSRAIIVHAASDQAGQVVSQSDAASLDSVRNVISDTAYGKQVETVTETAVVVPKAASSVPLTIKRQPADCGGQLGDLVSFKVVAEGEGLTYQWQLSDDGGQNWRNSANKTSAYSTTLTQNNNGRYVRCIVTDATGLSVASDPAKMAAVTELRIIEQPADAEGGFNDELSFWVEAEGDDLDFVWEYSDDDGETWQSYDAVEPDFCVYVDEDTDGRLVRCVITDAYGNTAASDPARMMLRYELFIMSQPENVTVYEGSELYVILTESNRNGIYRCVAVDFQGQSTVSEAATVVITDEDED